MMSYVQLSIYGIQHLQRSVSNVNDAIFSEVKKKVNNFIYIHKRPEAEIPY